MTGIGGRGGARLVRCGPCTLWAAIAPRFRHQKAEGTGERRRWRGKEGPKVALVLRCCRQKSLSSGHQSNQRARTSCRRPTARAALAPESRGFVRRACWTHDISAEAKSRQDLPEVKSRQDLPWPVHKRGEGRADLRHLAIFLARSLALLGKAGCLRDREKEGIRLTAWQRTPNSRKNKPPSPFQSIQRPFSSSPVKSKIFQEEHKRKRDT